LTPDIRRNETGDFGLSDWPTPARPAPYDPTSAQGDATPDPMAQTAPMLLADFGYDERDAGHQTEPGRTAARGNRRHANARRKTSRKRAARFGPAVAVAATAALTAGAAAYVLVGGGHPGAGEQSASMTLHSAVVSQSISGAGAANTAASAPVEVAKATAHVHARAYAKHAGGGTHKAAPSQSTVTQPETGSSGNTSSASAPAPAASSPAASTATSSSGSSTATVTSATAVSCGSSGLLPANVSAIVSFLLSHGYSDNAAAGIAGNIYQESKGNPESVGSGGGGLIGWTPLPAGFVTGNVSADLQTQLAQILVYNQGWSQFLPELMSASSPSDAASIYVTDFERAGIPAASTRETSAQDVASACGI
jgi:hypothetical protein